MREKLGDSSLVNISVPMLLYVSYLVFLSVNDTVSLGLYFMGYPKYNAFIGLAALGLTLILLIISNKKMKIVRYKPGFWGYVSIVLIFVCGFMKSIMPDFSWDVMAGRGFWQFPGFQDNIEYNLFPAGFTYFFPLSDRMFYYPRVILGYRLGTIFNTLVMILCYLETRALIKELLGDDLIKAKNVLLAKKKKNIFNQLLALIINENVLALMANILYYAIADLGTYLIDMVAIPLLIFLLRQLLKKEKDSNMFQFIFFALLCGLCFALKMTNAVLIAPILLLYLIKNRKSLNIFIFCVCVIVGIAPSALYLLYSYMSTGNPVYWTYNAIFKSPYYIDKNFKDTRWGPTNVVEYLLWPIKVIVSPKERVSELSRYPQIYLLLGCLSSLIILLKTLRKRVTNRGYSVLAAIFLVMYILWLVSTGYPRYAILCELISVILFAIILVDTLIKGKLYSRIIVYIGLGFLVLQFGFNYLIGINNTADWGGRNTILNCVKNGRLAENMQWLLQDRGAIGTDEQHEKVDVFLSMVQPTHFLMKLFNEDTPIINGKYVMSYFVWVKNEKGIDHIEYYKDKVDKLNSEGQGIYDIALIGNLEETCDVANLWGVEIIEAEFIPNYFDSRISPLLLRYEISEKENSYKQVDTVLIDRILSEDETLNVHGIVFVDLNAEKYSQIEIISNRNGQEETMAEFSLLPGEFCDLSKDLDLPEVAHDAQVSITVNNQNSRTYAINLWLE